MKYIKLFDNLYSNSLSVEVTSNIINDINDILIEVRDESNLGLVLTHKFQFDKNDREQFHFYISGKTSFNQKEFNMKDILDEVLQIISYMESNGFPLASLKYRKNSWYDCELVDKTIKGSIRKPIDKSGRNLWAIPGDYYFEIEGITSVELKFFL